MGFVREKENHYSRITLPHFIFEELLSVKITPPITPNSFWGVYISVISRKNYTTLSCPGTS